MSKQHQFDILIIGSGAAGLMSAIQLSENLSIAVIAKDEILEGSSYYAQAWHFCWSFSKCWRKFEVRNELVMHEMEDLICLNKLNT